MEAEDTSAEVSVAIFNDFIVEENETFTVDLSVSAAEAALGVSVGATDGTAYVEIQDNGKQNPLRMHIIVCSITLLVMGQVSVEFTAVVDITG